MNHSENNMEIDQNYNSKQPSLKSSLNKNIYEINSSNKKDEEKSNKEPFEKEEKEKEEEINSDEYVSSTNLDVDTNTYINMTNDTKHKEIKNYNKNIINYPGRLRTKLLNNNCSDFKKKLDELSDNGINNIFLMNNKENNNSNEIDYNNYYNITEKNIHNKRRINQQNEFINNSLNLKNQDSKKDSISRQKKFIFTPNNEDKKKYCRTRVY